jgi:type III secretion protein V
VSSLVRNSKLSVSEVVLASVVVAIVAMLVVPLPTLLLDVLLAANLSVAVTILLVVLFVPDALGIATFPTILLLTTLFRLALNVSSARLILLQGNAGDVIAAFGTFVVRGNYVVGAVIFLILTIIQFVVITKGSERVAEVGARFVLDAMPGKQMAIDAELRSGAIDGTEARKRRHKLSRESQFYGSMDGAMKFVKGDVIASLIITVVNILGGLAIGTLQRGIPVGDALKKYGLLTIGDGLVSQIPALVLSTAAGILVTRIASEEPGTPLGNELGAQLLGTPKALTVASVFVCLLGLTPGLPKVPFLLIGVALFFTARAREKQMKKAADRAGSDPLPQREGDRTTAEGNLRFVPVVAPWSVEVSPDLEELLISSANGPGLTAQTADLRERIFLELGVPLPVPRVKVNEKLAAGTAQLSVYEVPAKTLALDPQEASEEQIARILQEASELLTQRGPDFIGLTETQRLLDELEQYAPATVRNVVPKPISVQLLSDILRRLVEERVSIRDLRSILEALAQVGAQEKDALALTEYVRSQLKRAITHATTRGQNTLSVMTLDSMIEDSIRRAITRTAAGSYLALAPAVGRDIVAAVKRAQTAASLSGAFVLLTPADIRRFTKKFLEVDFPDLTVISFNELLPETAVRELQKASLSGLEE